MKSTEAKARTLEQVWQGFATCWSAEAKKAKFKPGIVYGVRFVIHQSTVNPYLAITIDAKTMTYGQYERYRRFVECMPSTQGGDSTYTFHFRNPALAYDW